MRTAMALLVSLALAGCVPAAEDDGEPAGGAAEAALAEEKAEPAAEPGAPAGEKAPADARPKLPEGDNGIAAKYPGDAGIGKDGKVIFAEGFESESPDALKGDWNGVKNRQIMTYVDDVPKGSAGKKSLLMTFVGGKGSGAHLYKSFKQGHEKVHLRFYTKIDRECFPIHHFVHMGGYNPPTPWPQGGAGIRPDGAKRFSTAVEPHGKAWRWDYYTYWMEMGGSPPKGQTWGNSFIRDKAPKVRKGEWECLEIMLKLNKPEEHDGEQAIWVNGKLVSHLGKGFPKGKWIFDKWELDKGGYSVRWSDEKKGRVERQVPEGGEPFEGFRWRRSAQLKLNYLWILLYITKAPEGHVSKVSFDDIVLAKEYIGPIKSKE